MISMHMDTYTYIYITPIPPSGIASRKGSSSFKAEGRQGTILAYIYIYKYIYIDIYKYICTSLVKYIMYMYLFWIGKPCEFCFYACIACLIILTFDFGNPIAQ